MSIQPYDEAFGRPETVVPHNANLQTARQVGMSSRDYAAIHIVAALATAHVTHGTPGAAVAFADEIADWAYTIADAMVRRSNSSKF